MTGRLDELTSWHADWKGLRVAVLGLSMTGFSVADTLAEATLKRPEVRGYIPEGKHGRHSEHLSYLLGEMQGLARAHPGATW